MKFISLGNFLNNLMDNFRKLQSNPTFGRLLLFLSLIYPIILIGVSWQDIIEMDFYRFFGPFLVTLLLSSFSLIFQSLNWALIVNGNFSAIYLDLEIYFKTILMRKLPGGFWHWMGRVNLYNNSSLITYKFSGLTNVKEFLYLILTGLVCFLLINYPYWGLLGILLLFILVIYFFSSTGKLKTSFFFYASILIILYIICWVLGGGIIYIFVNVLAPEVSMPLSKSVSIWTITGSLGMLFFLIPNIFFIRELTLVALLSPFMDYSKIFLLSLLVRLTLTFGDVLIALFGLVFLRIKSK